MVVKDILLQPYCVRYVCQIIRMIKYSDSVQGVGVRHSHIRVRIVGI
jgi:hypothetical protein